MGANYVLINEQTLNASAASVTFSSIPQTGYTDLKIVISTRYSNAISMGGFGIYFNGVTTNQSGKYLLGTGSAASSGSGILVDSDGASDTANTFSSTEIYIPNYTSSNYKSFSIDNVSEANATYAEQIMTAGLWSSASAITSVGFARGSASWDAGSSFSLYGIAAVGTTPTVVPKASGGDIVTNDGTYWIHTFYNSGTFIPNTALSCDYLVVAGGGGGGGTGNGTNGGYPGAGGGGAGGYRTSIGGSPLSLTSNTSYTVTVGAGGAGKYLTGGAGTSGSNSVFSTITSTGGGGGSSHNGSALSGGSGGGADGSGTNTTGGSASPSGQGNAGGNYVNGNGAAGGGGASATGSNSGAGSSGGAGGAGSSNSISGTATYYAGGGGGGSYSGGSGGAGGVGGGGNGGTYNSGGVQNGTVNTGGGGGGAGQINTTSGLTGGTGGSGIVIVRYTMA